MFAARNGSGLNSIIRLAHPALCWTLPGRRGSDVAAPATAAGFDDVRVLTPGETGYYQPVVRAVAPPTSCSD
jgi:hypothetical protein